MSRTKSRDPKRHWWRGQWISGLAYALALLAAGCGGGDETALPPSPPVIDITMREYRLDYGRPVPRGRVVFRGHNAGRIKHSLTLLSLPEDFPPLEEELRNKEASTIAPVANLHALEPGESDAFAVDLAPGRYGLVDFQRGRDRVYNAIKGANSEFRVR